MTSREQDNFVQNPSNQNHEELRRRSTRQLNDRFRSTGRGGKVVITQGVQALDQSTMEQVIRKVINFDQFDESNDPYGEHDMGSFQHNGQRFFWKIDYYDLLMHSGSPDPADPTVTTRVMTVMLASEY